MAAEARRTPGRVGRPAELLHARRSLRVQRQPGPGRALLARALAGVPGRNGQAVRRQLGGGGSVRSKAAPMARREFRRGARGTAGGAGVGRAERPAVHARPSRDVQGQPPPRSETREEAERLATRGAPKPSGLSPTAGSRHRSPFSQGHLVRASSSRRCSAVSICLLARFACPVALRGGDPVRVPCGALSGLGEHSVPLRHDVLIEVAADRCRRWTRNRIFCAAVEGSSTSVWTMSSGRRDSS